MAESQCIRIPLIAEHAEAFAEWVRGLASKRPAELTAVLKHEGMLAELIFLERVGDEVALILYTRAASLEESNKAYETSTHPIDLEMKEWEKKAFKNAEAKTVEIVFEHGQPG